MHVESESLTRSPALRLNLISQEARWKKYVDKMVSWTEGVAAGAECERAGERK